MVRKKCTCTPSVGGVVVLILVEHIEFRDGVSRITEAGDFNFENLKSAGSLIFK